jgi:hypothetical protein
MELRIPYAKTASTSMGDTACLWCAWWSQCRL